jgi:hypothetical protein
MISTGNYRIINPNKDKTMNEETMYQDAAGRPVNSPKTKKEAAKRSKSTLRDILLSGGSMVSGAGLAFATQSMINPEELITEDLAETSENLSPAPEPVIYQEAPVATGINDSMSFNEAFASARHELGAGGVFEYRGNVYNTYYAEEWNSLSDDQRTEYAQSVDIITTSEDPVMTDYEETDASLQGIPDPTGSAPQEVDYADTPIQDVADPTDPAPQDIDYAGEGTETAPAGEVEMEILAVETDEFGNTYISADTDQNAVADIYLADTDANGVIDAMIIDQDENQVADEVLDVTSDNILVSDIVQDKPAEEQQVSDQASIEDPDMPDYMNDADVSEFS